jgi:thioredoxin 2
MRLAKVNTEEAQNLAARLQIRSIPTLALFVGGREVARQPGPWARPTSCAGRVRTCPADRVGRLPGFIESASVM